MKKNKNFIMCNVAGQNIIVPVNKASIEYNAVINLNETGAFLFEKLESDVSEEDLVSALLSEYDVSREKAAQDVKTFIERLKNENIIEE